MRLLSKIILSVAGMTVYYTSHAQTTMEVYRKPLTEVLKEVETKFHVKVNYDDKLVRNLQVNYATWRFTSDVTGTLDNILKPLELSYKQSAKNVFQLSQYDYYRRSEAEGKKHLDQLLTAYPDAKAFDQRKKELKECIASALGINMDAKRTPLNVISRSKVIMDGYSVENVAFESIPGYFVTGTLYKPTKGNGPFPVILNPHGHFFNEQDPSVSKDSGRYRADMQYRCAGFARMGAVVLNYDMYGWGESMVQTGGPQYHETGFAASIQTWNSIRALDFLLSIPNTDKTRVGITGASGGGTQTILAAALDNRITMMVPVVMVSSSFYGGCPCESGLPIHDDCKGNKTNNAEIAAMIAPRPMMVISDGDDWTKSVPGTDYPYLQKVYAFYGKTKNVESVYLPNDKHDYGITKRRPMYQFVAKVFGLNLQPITGKGGSIDDRLITVLKNRDQLVFTETNPLLAGALHSHDEIMRVFKSIHAK
ncbi:MAG: acetylxylan esterase [Bacteroidota bacterium]